MSSSGPSEENPFEGMPFFADLARMMQGSGPVNWEIARQFANQVATGGAAEANPDPLERIRLEELSRVADLRVADATGLTTSTTGGVVLVVPVTRAEWVRTTLEAWRPLLERLSASLSAASSPEAPDADADPTAADPTAGFLGGLFTMMGPALLGMQAGSMVGHLASRSLGQYDLPLPRPPGDELQVVSANLAAFADEWSLPGDDLRLWVLLSELTTHAVLGVPHVRARMERLVFEYVSTFSVDPSALEDTMSGVDLNDPASIPAALGDPERLLGALQSPRQRELLPALEALLATIVGYVDSIMDRVGGDLIGSYGQLTEALRRRRVEADPADRMVERLLGLELGPAQYERGQTFASGVLERGGPEALSRLWHSERELPTPAEVDAPGLWLARIDLPD